LIPRDQEIQNMKCLSKNLIESRLECILCVFRVIHRSALICFFSSLHFPSDHSPFPNSRSYSPTTARCFRTRFLTPSARRGGGVRNRSGAPNEGGGGAMSLILPLILKFSNSHWIPHNSAAPAQSRHCVKGSELSPFRVARTEPMRGATQLFDFCGAKLRSKKTYFAASSKFRRCVENSNFSCRDFDIQTLIVGVSFYILQIKTRPSKDTREQISHGRAESSIPQ
jgi:hypothetical protein